MDWSAEILKKFLMENSKPTSLCDVGAKLTKATSDSELFDKEVYQSAIGSLLYLSMRTRRDIAYAVGIVARFYSQPTKEHWTTVKHILRYLNGIQNYGLLYSSGETSDLIGYSDVDWAGDINDCKSTIGYLFKLGGATISRKSQKQTSMALSTADAESMAPASAAQEAVCSQHLANDLNETSVESTVIYEDN